MDAVLSFFSNLILFTAGMAVALLWLVLIVIVIDEVIDLVINHRNKTSEEESA